MKIKRGVIITIIVIAVVGAVVAGIFLFGETIIVNIFGNGNLTNQGENEMSPECQTYAIQMGMNENTDCEGADRDKCINFCTSHPECCENMPTGNEEEPIQNLTVCQTYGMQMGMNETTDCEGADMNTCINYCNTYPQCCQNQSGSP